MSYKLPGRLRHRRAKIRQYTNAECPNIKYNEGTVKFRYYDHLKIKTFYPLKTLFAKFKLFFSSFSTPSVSLIKDHLWDCPKVVLKTPFGQPQRRS